MKMVIIIFLGQICIFGQSCYCLNKNYSQEEIVRKTGIIQQCRTVYGYDIPKEEKEKRIYEYLQFNVKNEDLSEKEQTLINLCFK